jgi:hypothetical protein
VPPLHRLPLGRSADLSPSFSRRCDAPRGSDSVSYFRCVFGRFTFVHLLSSYLPASYGRFLQQSLTTMAFWATAALPGLKPASARRLRGAYPHLLYSTGNPIHRLPVHVAPPRILSRARLCVTQFLRTTGSSFVVARENFQHLRLGRLPDRSAVRAAWEQQPTNPSLGGLSISFALITPRVHGRVTRLVHEGISGSSHRPTETVR